METKLTAQEHLEAAQKIEDTFYKLEKGEDIAEAVAQHEEHMKQVRIMNGHGQ